MGTFLSVSNSVLAFFTTVFVIVLGAARLSSRVRRLLVTTSLRWAGTRALSAEERRDTKVARAVLRRHLQEFGEGADASPAAMLGDALRQSACHRWPWSPWRESLETWARHASAPGTTPLLARIVVPEEAERVRGATRRLAELMGRYRHLRPVPVGAAQLGKESPAAFASALSGAAVVADATSSRGAAADSVVAWHSLAYRDGSHTWEDRATYAEVGAGTTTALGDYRLGDYNGRLLELRGVALAANTRDGTVSFVLETSETCYQATEQGDRACKGLGPAAEDENLPRFQRSSDGATTLATWRQRPDALPRICMVTAYVSLLARAEAGPSPVVVHGRQDERPCEVLILCRRSSATRNGRDTLSAAAGGVVEMDQPDKALDTDSLGLPCIDAAIRREMREEIGLAGVGMPMAPVAVWISTVLGRRSTRPTGQVVGSVLCLANVSTSLSEVHRSRSDANHVRGGFEVNALEAIAIGKGPAASSQFAHEVWQLAPALDQHGLLSCWYAAIRIWGWDKARSSFADAFAQPWWVVPWEGEPPGRLRICRDPREILPEDTALIDSAESSWTCHFERLRAGLVQAQGRRAAEELASRRESA